MAAPSPALHVKPGAEWAAVLGRASAVAPEAFGSDRLFNLIDGSWRPNGDPEVLISPVDGAKAVTHGPESELLYGNFPEHSRYPATI